MADPQQQRIDTLEAELAALRAEMQDFSYTVSHDLRASLRHILSYAQLVQEDAGPLLPDETRGFLDTISDSARHMGLLMDGLMELSRLGSVALHIEAVPLDALLRDLAHELALQHPQRSLQWQIADALPAVQADAALLRKALYCVLENAVKFTAQRPTALIAIATDAAGAPGMVTLTVQDNGAGFNPALQAGLFHPFKRLHTTKQFAGIGMGLALTRKILQRLDGRVDAQGAPEAGCTINLTLPGTATPP